MGVPHKVSQSNRLKRARQNVRNEYPLPQKENHMSRKLSRNGFPNFRLLPAFQEVQRPVLHLQKEGKELRGWTLLPLGRHCIHTICFPFSQEPLLSWEVSFRWPEGLSKGLLPALVLSHKPRDQNADGICARPKLCLPALPPLHLVMGWKGEISQQQSLPCNLRSNITP